MSNNHKGKRRVAIPAVVTAGIGSMLLAFSLTPAFSAAVASIQNTNDTAGTGFLAMEETGPGNGGLGSFTCDSDGVAHASLSTNSATCSTVNKYGGNMAMVPGATPTVTNITIKNTGTIPATTFTLTPGACTQSANGTANGSATDLCTKMNIVIKSGVTTVFTGTAAALAAHAPFSLAAPVAGGATVPFEFDVQLDSSAGNTYQGLQISQPLTWTFNS